MKNRVIHIIALSALSVAVIGLTVYSFLTHRQLEEYRYNEIGAREAVFEGLVSSAEKIGNGLKKLSISRDAEKRCELLSDLYRDAAQTAAGIDRAELGEEDKRELESFLNRVGDYAHQLEKKTRREETIDTQDAEQLKAIAQTIQKITEQLRFARENGYETSLELDAFFAEREQSFAVETYPQPEYAGEFSQTTQNRAPLGLPGYSVTEQKALKTAENFAACALRPVAHTDGDVIPFYNFESEDGAVRVSVTKQGGEVLYYKNESNTDGMSILPTEAKAAQLEKTAKEFLQQHEYGIFSAGWKNYYNGMAVFEMIPETEEGILLYPDSIKLWIAMDSGAVMGMDTRGYLMNHRERNFPGEILTAEQAQEKLSEELNLQKHALAVISHEDGSESYCHGFYCETGAGESWLIFLDAQTGAEKEIYMIEKNVNGESAV